MNLMPHSLRHDKKRFFFPFWPKTPGGFRGQPGPPSAPLWPVTPALGPRWCPVLSAVAHVTCSVSSLDPKSPDEAGRLRERAAENGREGPPAVPPPTISSPVPPSRGALSRIPSCPPVHPEPLQKPTSCVLQSGVSETRRRCHIQRDGWVLLGFARGQARRPDGGSCPLRAGRRQRSRGLPSRGRPVWDVWIPTLISEGSKRTSPGKDRWDSTLNSG